MVRVREIKLLLQGCQRSPIHQWLLLTPCQSHCSYPELQLKIHYLKYKLLNSAVQTPGFLPPAPAPAKKSPAPAKKLRLREKNSGSGRKHVKIEI